MQLFELVSPRLFRPLAGPNRAFYACLLYTSDAAAEEDSGDVGGWRSIKKKKKGATETRAT